MTSAGVAALYWWQGLGKKFVGALDLERVLDDLHEVN